MEREREEGPLSFFKALPLSSVAFLAPSSQQVSQHASPAGGVCCTRASKGRSTEGRRRSWRPQGEEGEKDRHVSNFEARRSGPPPRPFTELPS